MDHQSLVPIAHRAILQVLNYHFLSAENGCGLPALDGESRGKITTRIYRLLPLTSKSENKRSAYVEIICDAALIVANKYNINKRWFYASVQNLATMTLQPSIYENAGDPVPLIIPNQQQYEDTNSEDDQDMGQKEEEDVQPPALATHGTATPKSNGVAWSEAEIRQVIDMKIKGEPVHTMADRVGRSVSAIQNRWRVVNRPDSSWKGYIEQKTLEMYGGSDESDSDESDSETSDQSMESSEDEEPDEDVQPPASATDTSTVAHVPAAVALTRPFTHPDTKELINLKLEGLSNHEIEARMKRPYRSIHMTWLNVMNNTKGKWFTYILKLERAKRKRERREKRAKASQGGTGADEDLTGPSDSVSL